MRSQSKDLVDRLGCLSKALRENPHIIAKHLDRQPKPSNKPTFQKKTKQITKNIKRKRKQKSKHFNIIQEEDENYSHENTSPIKIQPELQIEEEEEDVEIEGVPMQKKNRHKLYLFGDSDDEEIYQYDDSDDDNLPSIDETEYKDNIENSLEFTQRQGITQNNIKSDLNTYLKMICFKKWRRNYQSKQIQASIERKIQPFDTDDPDPEIRKRNIYNPYLGQKKYKKINKNEQMSVLDRLSKPRLHRSSRPIMDNQNNNPNQIVIIGNSQYTPKSEEERQRVLNRKKIREIAMEIDGGKNGKKGYGMQVTQKGVRLTEKQLMKTLARLSEPAPKPEEPPKIKPDISANEQLAQSIRLSTPKKEIEEPKKKVNRAFLPTKYEQMEVCERLSKPKVKSTPIKMKKEIKYTLAEQTEICERLAQPKSVFIKNENELASTTSNKKRRKKMKKNQNNAQCLAMETNDMQTPANEIAKSVPSRMSTRSAKPRVKFTSTHQHSNKGEKTLSQQLNEVLDASYRANDNNGSKNMVQTEYAQRQSHDRSNSNTISSLQLDSEVGFTPFESGERLLDTSEIEKPEIDEIDEITPIDSKQNDFAEEEACNSEEFTNDDNPKSMSAEEKSEPVSNDTDSAVDYILDEHGL